MAEFYVNLSTQVMATQIAILLNNYNKRITKKFNKKNSDNNKNEEEIKKRSKQWQQWICLIFRLHQLITYGQKTFVFEGVINNCRW